jgi:formylglycine-generating enzyme required for sulfatase activity
MPKRESVANLADIRLGRARAGVFVFPDYDDGFEYTAPVGSFPQNGYGLFDIAGNALEWCGDWYGSLKGAPLRDPRGPEKGTEGLLRGGGWGVDQVAYECAHRFREDPHWRSDQSGFRCVIRLR